MHHGKPLQSYIFIDLGSPVRACLHTLNFLSTGNSPLFGDFILLQIVISLLTLAMRNPMMFGSVIVLLLLTTTAHGLRRLDLDMHAAPNKNKEEIEAGIKWQRLPSSSGRPANRASDDGCATTTTSEDHASTAGAAAEEDREVKKRTRAHRVVPPTLIHDDYAGPSDHSPNHHRTIRCGPC